MRPLSTMHTVADFREGSRRALPAKVFDFIDGGAGDELALARNREAFRAITVVPRVGIDTRHVTLQARIAGVDADAPFGIAPLGLTGLVHPQADRILARAAARANLPFVLSACASTSIEDVAAAAGTPPWFQFYMPKSGAWRESIQRIAKAGCPVLVLTMDAAAPGKRLRDTRNGLRLPLRPGLRDWLRHPRWCRSQRSGGALGFPNLTGGEGVAHNASFSELMARQTGGAMAWEQVAALRDAWPRTLVVKGVLAAADAAHALGLGVDAVIVSNHGGRQLDCAPAPVEVVPDFVQAGLRPEQLMLDSGVRCGEDVVKALSVGAGAVFVGRPFLYALATHGAAGVERLIELLAAETASSMRLVGATSVREFARDPSSHAPVSMLGTAHPVPA
jgi:isopentenyl diphosphate isomerase/L-lactate dehydrogenase-like FMN-dependent dehydrogenase